MDLKTRVTEAKTRLKKLVGSRGSKIGFFDSTYGLMDKAENIRLDNLWATYTTDEQFTKDLENYVSKVNLGQDPTKLKAHYFKDAEGNFLKVTKKSIISFDDNSVMFTDAIYGLDAYLDYATNRPKVTEISREDFDAAYIKVINQLNTKINE